MKRYAMATVVESDDVDKAWEEFGELVGFASDNFAVQFIGDPFPIATQDEYDSGEAARAILSGVAALRGVSVGAVGGPRSEEADAALLPCGCSAGAGGTCCEKCRPETGAMSTSDGLGAAALVEQRAVQACSNLVDYMRSGEKEGLRNVVRVELEKAGYLI